MSNITEKTSRPSAQLAKDRRADPRYKFKAHAELVEKASDTKIETRVKDLGPRGCFLEAANPFPVGTDVTVRITRGEKLFEAQGRVVSCSVAKDMGLFFTDVESAQAEILAEWLIAALETSWLTSTRRRSQRLLLRLPVRVIGKNRDGSPWQEDTHTNMVNVHGASVFLSAAVSKGQRVTLSSETTGGSSECVVAHIGEVQDKRAPVGLAFRLPNPKFWNVAFPPEDWSVRHPDAKGRPGIHAKKAR